MIGVSTHTPEQVDEALAGPAHYVAVGPVFSTNTKDTGYTARGLDLVDARVRTRQTGGRDRRHHAGDRAGGSWPPAPLRWRSFPTCSTGQIGSRYPRP